MRLLAWETFWTGRPIAHRRARYTQRPPVAWTDRRRLVTQTNHTTTGGSHAVLERLSGRMATVPPKSSSSSFWPAPTGRQVLACPSSVVRARGSPLRHDNSEGALKVRPASNAPELFLYARGHAMTRSNFEYVLAKRVATASRAAPLDRRQERQPRMCCDTPTLCILCGRPATCGRSHSGSDTPACKAPRSTCAPTRLRSLKPTLPWRHRCSSPGDSARPTSSWLC